jgi:hypothetical protein
VESFDHATASAEQRAEWAGQIASLVAEPTPAERIEYLCGSLDDAHDALAEARAEIEQLQRSLAMTQTWLTEASAENIELRRRIDGRA